MAEISKDIKTLVEKSGINQAEHREIKKAIGSLFLWKATIVGMGIVVVFIGSYVINDYLNTKKMIISFDKRLSTVESYFEKSK